MKAPFTLVTEASGFLGCALVRRLLQRGQRVKGLVRPGADLRSLRGLETSALELVLADSRLESSLYRALAGCDRVFHVGVTVTPMLGRARLVERATTSITALLEAARARGTRRIVVTSSIAVLGVPRGDELLDEASHASFSDPDARVLALVAAERTTADYARRGMPIITLLPALTLGPGEPPSSAGARVLLAYLKLPPARRVPITEGGISLVDVDDVVEGHCRAMERGRAGERYVLGGDNLGYRDLLQLLYELSGLGRPGDTARPALLALGSRALELWTRLRGAPPLLTQRLVRDYAHARVWVSSNKAEREFGYSHRPAREVLSRALGYYLEQGFLPEERARTIRLDRRAARTGLA